MRIRSIRYEWKWRTLDKVVIHTESKGEITEYKRGTNYRNTMFKMSLWCPGRDREKNSLCWNFRFSHSCNCTQHRSDYFGARVKGDHPGKHLIQWKCNTSLVDTTWPNKVTKKINYFVLFSFVLVSKSLCWKLQHQSSFSTGFQSCNAALSLSHIHNCCNSKCNNQSSLCLAENVIIISQNSLKH